MSFAQLPIGWQTYVTVLEATVRRLHALNVVLVGVVVLVCACFIVVKIIARFERKKVGESRLISVGEGLVVQRMLVQLVWQGVRPIENLKLGFVVIDNIVAASSAEHHAFGGSVVMMPVTRGQILQDVIEGRGAAYRINANRTVDMLTPQELIAWRDSLPESTCTHRHADRRAAR